MKRLILLAVIAVCSAVPTFSQGSDDYKKVEFFGGFSHNRVDSGIDAEELGGEDEDLDGDFLDDLADRQGLNGFNASLTGNVSRYVGLKFDVSGHYKSEDVNFFDSNLGYDISLYNFLGGVQIKDNASTSTVKPFAHFLAGAARSNLEINGNVAGTDIGEITGEDLSISDTAFAAAIGGGLDIRLNDRIDIRAIQVDYNPTRFDDSTQHNFRFGFGIVLH
jgi:hypothetical protein